MKTKRIVNMDLLRCCALFLLVSVYFFLNTGFYDTNINGLNMYVASFLRTTSMMCIPLFLLLTGYLKNKKELSKKYYNSIIRILLVYLLAMIINYSFYSLIEYQTLPSIKSLIIDILSFKNSAWYINLYIGLFLLIPFLNIIYNNIKKEQKKYLLITLIFLTALPAIINYKIQIIPNWYINFYPLTYYFLGAYLSEIKIKLQSIKLFLIWLLVIIINTTINIFLYNGTLFRFDELTNWGSIENVLSSFTFFIFVKSLNLTMLKKFSISILKNISNLSLGAYLVSPIVERVIYHFLNKKYLVFTDRFNFWFPCVLLIIIFSLMISLIIDFAYKNIIKFISHVKKYVDNKAKNIKDKIFNYIKIFCLVAFVLLIMVFSFKIVIYKVFTINDTNLGWHKYSKTQVLGDEDTGTLFDPTVVIDSNGKYRMYVSSRKNSSISISLSDDGIKWTKPKVVFSPSGNSTWDKVINRNSIVYKDNKYYMWYTGQSDEISKIGLAVSEDGYNFTKVGEGPVIIPEYDYEGTNVMNPYVIWDNDDQIFKMWYAAGEYIEPDTICYATSTDGINWFKYEKNPIITASSSEKFYDSYKVGAAEVYKLSIDSYLMFYIGYTDLNTARIFYATSNDGIKWNRKSDTPIISPSINGFDSEATYKPTAIYNQDNDQWMLWYNGRNKSDEYIGLAICKHCKFEI